MSSLSVSLLVKRSDSDTEVMDHVADFSSSIAARDYVDSHLIELREAGWSDFLVIDADNPFYQGYFHTIPKEVVKKCC